jgi:methylmalonyl-CoA/ethylmalonyl-CoA epimerase
LSIGGKCRVPEVKVDPKLVFRDLKQIGVVVRDLDRTLEALSETFGIVALRTLYWPPADRPDFERFYYGQATDFTCRIAFARLGTVELEIIQPLEGRSIWSDFLDRHGDGIHHIRFNVEDIETQQVIDFLSGQGIQVSQRGSGLRQGTDWVCFDTEEKVGFCIEIMKAVPGTDGMTPKS